MTTQLESSIVRIRAANGRTIGAGFLVGEKQVLTCAHVIAQTLDLTDDALETPHGEVHLDFPLIAPGCVLTAHVIRWQPESDVAGLELDDDPPAGVRPVCLMAADDLWEHSFRAFGFSVGHEDGVWASGVLRGPTAAGWVHIEDVKEPGFRVQPGFSGAPVWDQEFEGVVGMAVAAERQPEVKAAFMIPADVVVQAWPDLERILQTPAARPGSKSALPWTLWAMGGAAVLILVSVAIWSLILGPMLDRKPPVTTPVDFLTQPSTTATATTTSVSKPGVISTATDILPTPTSTSPVLPTDTPALTPLPTNTAQPSTPTRSGSPPANVNCGETWVRPKDGMTMVYVPAGDFQMGSETGESDERPIHLVHLDGFWIDQFEITNSAFEQFVLEAGYQTDAEKAGWGSIWQNGQWNRVDGLDWRYPNNPNEGISAIMDHPVIQASWNDADAYCQWVGGRLPTEAEWEMAAVGTTGWRYPWGNEFDPTRLNASQGGTVRVGSYETGKSPCDAYDMAGNVWEWVNDWYQSDYYSIAPSPNPQGLTTGTYKVLRGGGWDPSGGDSRSQDRGALSPSNRGNTIGFRCAWGPQGH